MRRSTVLEGCTLLSVGAGLLACAQLGGWLPGATLVGGVLCVGAPIVRHHLRAVPWAPLTGGLALVGFIVPLVLGGTLVDALGASLLILQVARRWARTSPGDDRASAVLAALMIVLSASLDPDVLAGLAAVLWLLAAAPLGVLTFLARVGSQRRPDPHVVGTHLASLSVLVVVTAVLVFIALPRLRPADLGRDDPTLSAIGFSDQVELGDVGSLLDDPTPVLRLILPEGAPEPRYVRGIVLDRFDGRAWTATLPDVPDPLQRPPDAVPVDVIQEGGAGGVAFAPGMISSIESSSATFVPDAAGSWRVQGRPRRLTYTAWMAPDPVDTTPEERWTALPADLDPRIGELADRVFASDASAVEAGAQISAWLERNATYTFSPRDGALEAPLETFLFERRTGHCEYFATAAAVLLRAAGHPSRIVNGYAQPEFSAVGGYWLARQGHAHSWVEVRDPQGRWHLVDPTPGGSRPPAATSLSEVADAMQTWWTDQVLSYDGSAQLDLLRGAGWWVQSRVTGSSPGDAMPWLGLVVVLGAVGSSAALGLAALRRLGRHLAGEAPARPHGALARVHHRARRLVLREGFQVPASLPPVEAARWLAHHVPEAGASLEQLAWLHYEVQYGEADEGTRLSRAREILKALRVQLRSAATRGTPPDPARGAVRR